MIYWFIGFLMAIAGLSIYLELASYFPNRSGSEVVYLEQAYPRPKHFFPIAFAVQSVLLSFSSSNAIGESLWRRLKPLRAWSDRVICVQCCRDISGRCPGGRLPLGSSKV